MKLFSFFTLVILLKGCQPSNDVGLLTTYEDSVIKCVTTIANNHFSSQHPLHVSVYKPQVKSMERTLMKNGMHPKPDSVLIDYLLQKISEESKWSLQVTILGSTGYATVTHEDPVKKSSYLIFIWEDEEEIIIESLIDQMEELHFDSSWNSKAAFLIVIFVQNSLSGSSIALIAVENLWKYYNVLNSVVLLCPNFPNFVNMGSKHTSSNNLQLFTWFPYISKDHCDQVNEVVLIDQWIISRNEFIFNLPIFIDKLPKNLLGCPIKVSTSEVPFQVKLISQHTNRNNKTVYTFTGLEMLCLFYVKDALNFTLEFLVHAGNDHFNSHLSMITEVFEGKSDVAVSSFPLHAKLLEMVDPTVTYFPCYLRWYVPCGRSVPRMAKLVHIFTLSVWITMAIVLLSTISTIWCLGRTTNKSKVKELSSYRKISSVIYNVFSVIFGVSVPQLPRTSKLRAFFSLWVWYCFAISMIFQVYFTTFLVDPGIQKSIRTLEELLNSGFKYACNKEWDDFIKFTTPEYYSKINLEKVYCKDFECYEFVLNSSDFLTVSSSPLFAYYTSSSLHTTNLPLCSIEEDIFRMDVVMYLQKGNPLVKYFNSAIRALMEFGLLSKYHQDMKILLKAEGISSIYSSDEFSVTDYFVFSTAHLIFAFYILGMGYSLSSLAFIAEMLYAAEFQFRKC
ncbi:Ionotropic receptor 248 [Blattella germanica]|nr:Ionotropic receptor 248 [Blattella germanica]